MITLVFCVLINSKFQELYLKKLIQKILLEIGIPVSITVNKPVSFVVKITFLYISVFNLIISSVVSGKIHS